MDSRGGRGSVSRQGETRGRGGETTFHVSVSQRVFDRVYRLLSPPCNSLGRPSILAGVEVAPVVSPGNRCTQRPQADRGRRLCCSSSPLSAQGLLLSVCSLHVLIPLTLSLFPLPFHPLWCRACPGIFDGSPPTASRTRATLLSLVIKPPSLGPDFPPLCFVSPCTPFACRTLLTPHRVQPLKTLGSFQPPCICTRRLLTRGTAA